MANCSPYAYWVGHTEDQGVTSDIDGRISLYFQGTDVWDSNEPNDLTGVENCVRLHGDRFRDAKCDLQSTDHARSGIGMGYICEFDESRGTFKLLSLNITTFGGYSLGKLYQTTLFFQQHQSHHLVPWSFSIVTTTKILNLGLKVDVSLAVRNHSHVMKDQDYKLQIRGR